MYIHTYIYIYIYICIYADTYIHIYVGLQAPAAEVDLTVDFRNFIVFFGPRPWHIEIRHRVKKTPTINLFGFETLKLKIRRLKLWKPTAIKTSQYIVYTCRHQLTCATVLLDNTCVILTDTS